MGEVLEYNDRIAVAASITASDEYLYVIQVIQVCVVVWTGRMFQSVSGTEYWISCYWEPLSDKKSNYSIYVHVIFLQAFY